MELSEAAAALEVNLVMESLKFMVLGISVVFLFLTLLVGVLLVQGWVVRRFFPEKPAPVGSIASTGSSATTAGGDNLAAVIMTAITMYRKKRKS